MKQCQDLASFTEQEGEACAMLPAVPSFQLSASWQNPRTSLILLQDFPHWDPTKNLLIFSPRTVKPSNVSLQRRDAGQRRDVGEHLIW